MFRESSSVNPSNYVAIIASCRRKLLFSVLLQPVLSNITLRAAVLKWKILAKSWKNVKSPHTKNRLPWQPLPLLIGLITRESMLTSLTNRIRRVGSSVCVLRETKLIIAEENETTTSFRYRETRHSERTKRPWRIKYGFAWANMTPWKERCAVRKSDQVL